MAQTPKKPRKKTFSVRQYGSCARRITAGHYIPLLNPPNPYPRSRKTCRRTPPCERHTAGVRRQFAAKKEIPLRVSLLRPLTTFHRPAGEIARRFASMSELTYSPSALSSLFMLGTTRAHKRRNHCLAVPPLGRPGNFRFRSTDSYLGHTPPLRRFNHPAYQARHRATKRGCRSGSCVSHILRSMDHVAIGCYPEDTTAVCACLPACHSFQQKKYSADFPT